MGSKSIFANSNGSACLSNEDYHSESTTASDDGLSATYRIPHLVTKRFKEPSTVGPICCKIIEHFLVPNKECRDRMLLIDETLREFVQGMAYDKYHNAIVDFLIWTRSVVNFLSKRNVDKHQVNWVVKQLLHFVDEDIKMNRNEEEIKKAARSQLDLRTDCFDDMFEAAFLSKAYKEFASNLCTDLVFCEYVKFVFKKLNYDTEKAFFWIKNLDLCKYIEKLPGKEFVFYAVTGNQIGSPMELCQRESAKNLPSMVVSVLDHVAGASFPKNDPNFIALPPIKEYDGLKVYDGVVKMAFNFYKEFKLEKHQVKNCIFVRQMNAFIHAFRTYSNEETNKGREGFHQKMFHIMTEGGKRIQTAALSYLRDHGCLDDAFIMVLKLNIDDEDWPPGMTFPQELIDRVKQKVDKQNKVIHEEQLNIKNGFNLLGKGTHMVRMVDSEETVQKLLKPFIEDPKNEYFGLDTEWDMSYSGEIGTVCLIQMTSEHETMLIDIHTFRAVHNWTDEQFLELLKLIFDHPKKIYCFALDSDVSALSFNFPLFKSEILPKLDNLFCLHVAAKTIRGDIEMCNKVFGEHPPEELNLAALTKHMLGITLGKEEQSSVWSWRPLRKAQQKYAAMDSHAVVEITKKLVGSINENCPDKMDLAFVSWIKQKAATAAESTSSSGPRKTKSNHLKENDLKAVIEDVNEKLQQDEFTELDSLLYITDTMCSPIGSCMRRIGISVIPGANEAEVTEKATIHENAKILTTGRACKKYKFPGRVVNVNVTLSIEDQLRWFLFDEKICVNPNTIKPRCNKCNGKEFVYLPAICIRYLRYQKAVEKNIATQIDQNCFLEWEIEMEQMDPLFHSDHYCVLSRGEWGLTAVCPDAIIYFNSFSMQHLKDGVIVDPTSSIKLQLSMHLLTSEYDNNHLYAVCFNCGKENPDCIIDMRSQAASTD